MVKTFGKLIRLISDYKLAMLFASLLGFLTIGSGIGLMMTSAFIIASAALQIPIFKLQVAIVGVRFFGIARGVFRYLERYISHNVTFKLLARFRVWFFNSLAPLVPSKTFDYSSGDLLFRSIDDVESLEHIFVRVISPPLVFFGISCFMFFFLWMFNIRYSIFFITFYFTSGILIPFITLWLSKKPGKKIVDLKSRLEELSVDYFQGIKELLVYDLNNNWKSELLAINKEVIKNEYRINFIQNLHEILTTLVMSLTVATMLFETIPDVSSGKLNGIQLSVIIIGIMSSFEIIYQMPLAFQYLSKSLESAKRLFSIIEKNEIEIKINQTFIAPTVNQDFILKVQDLKFTYDKNIPVLKNINFEIKPKQKIAIVGPSGSGKSTLALILCELVPADEGKIIVGQNSCNIASSSNLKDIVSLVPQKVHLFSGTIKENLLIAKPNATDDELFWALKQADLLEFIEKQTKKLDSYILELGNNLSGGEIKKIGIARALLKNSPLVVFDEVTSHLDLQSELNILSAINEISESRSVLFITHRLTKMEIFDEILVLVNGEIVEKGNHKELICKSGFYYRMFSSFLSKFEYLS